MPEYLSPGIHIEEIPAGPKPIVGVSTGIAGFVGYAERGPLKVLALITSFAEYRRVFGDCLPEHYGERRFLPYAVEGFFTNGSSGRIYPGWALAERSRPGSIP